MKSLKSLIPDVEVLLALSPEELGKHLLRVARDQLDAGKFHPNNFTSTVVGVGMAATDTPVYPHERANEVHVALSEAWQWLRMNILVVPAPGTDGQAGFLMFSRRGRALAEGDDDDFARFQAAATFPKVLLHPAIADKVWVNLARGDLADAVFAAFRAVEESVRAAGGFGPTDIGIDLMRRAFAPKDGPLSDASHPEPERLALASLFAGAIGSYKNPHSHRTVSITDPREAQEMVLLASHLLRIVDSRQRRVGR